MLMVTLRRATTLCVLPVGGRHEGTPAAGYMLFISPEHAV